MGPLKRSQVGRDRMPVFAFVRCHILRGRFEGHKKRPENHAPPFHGKKPKDIRQKPASSGRVWTLPSAASRVLCEAAKPISI